MYLKSCLFCCLFLIFSITLHAQEKNVQFKITNQKNEPVSFATVTVVSNTDSSLLHQKLSDSSGLVNFFLVNESFYTVTISSVGFQNFEKNIAVKGAASLYVFSLQPVSKSLNNIVIKTSSKPLMRQEDDKTIIDPENLATISTNGFEILEKTPGLFIDPDGNIYISSTSPATIYINGREQKMSAADVATMLKSLPPTAIASIEILRTPSSKFDASGGGGIVNVVLKKGVRIGLTGSVNINLAQGKYGNQNVGFNLNNNNGAITTYLNLNVGRRSSFDRIKTDRLFSADSILSQDAYTKYAAQTYYVGYGLSYQLNKKWELSYDGRFSYNKIDNNSENISFLVKKSTAVISNNRQTDVNNSGHSYNINQGANLKYKIDSLGSEWTTDLSFTYTPNKTNQFFNFGDGALDNKLNFFSAKTDFVKKLAHKYTIENGIKTTHVNFNSNTNYFIISNGNRIKDNIRTGAYQYNESINAAYLQASKTLNSGIIIKAGTRVENTNMKGKQLAPADTSFSIHRTDLFPYIYISKTIMKIAGYDLRAYLVLRRTISRPSYEFLNPSLRFVDPYLYETGNPNLRPQFTNNYEANISVDERPIVAFGLNETKDIFTQVVYPTDTSSQVSFRTYDNLGTNKETYMRLLGVIPPGKKYFFVVGLQYNHNFYNGLYENKPFTFKRGSWTIFTYQTLKITPLTQFSLNGFARFKGQQQFYQLGPFGELRMSLNQQFFKKKLNVTVSVNDVFKTNQNEFAINQGSINATGLRQADTRRFGLNLRYNFGLRKKEDNNILNVESPEKTN